MRSPILKPFSMTLPWASVTPFGMAVEPEV
jgi:hypothetical protein